MTRGPIASTGARRPGRLPDFIIGGAPRCGTTWLYRALDRHPDIYMARPIKPEPKFFLVDELYEKGVDHYIATWFPDLGGKRLAGEKSANYLESEAAAARMHRCAPDLKLVFMLRNPVDRAFSNYLWSRMNGLESEDFATALRLEAERESSVPERWRHARPHALFSRGLYARMLRPYLRLFPRERILCLRFDDLTHRPADLLVRVHRFLEMPERAGDAGGLGEVNRADGSGTEAVPADVRRRLEAAYAQPNRELVELLGPDWAGW